MTNWNRFTGHFKKDLKLWLFLMLTLSFFRLIFITYFREKIGQATPWTEVVNACVNGMRYDAAAATYFILFPVSLTVLSGFADFGNFNNRVRRFYGSLLITLTAILSIVTLSYFKEYNDQFNHFIFNLYYDDTRAIFSTIWAGYHVMPNLIAMSVGSFFLVKAYNWFMASEIFEEKVFSRPFPVVLRVIMTIVMISLIFIGMRGSYGHRTVKLEDAAVTRDAFLNKAVLNPYSAATYAYTTHKKLAYITSGLDAYLPDGNVRKAAQELFNVRKSFDNLDEYLRRTAPGHANMQPKHIFLVVMESYDAWPMLAKYSSLGLTRELSKLAEQGVHVKHFLPASDGTATSLSAIISGLPDANVVTNYQKSSQQPYPSSIAESFKRLGYRTRFFYGGYLSWQKLGDFIKGQGFDEVYGAAHIGSWASHNEWGVEDEILFEFVLKNVEPANAQPSLNVILTTSYHPPYELDVVGKGFSLNKIPPDLSSEYDNTVSLKMLGHLWYSDRCVGNFVRSAEKKFENSLFALTGDHFGRKFINSRPNQFEASCVPFILYGKNVLRGISLPENAAGSHIDIAPTLIELTAPKGFSYYAIGQNVLSKGTTQIAINRDKVINSEFIFDINEKNFYPLPDKSLPNTLPDPKKLKLLHDQQSGISWWRIMRGEKL